jgi:hypothetical protein
LANDGLERAIFDPFGPEPGTGIDALISFCTMIS